MIEWNKYFDHIFVISRCINFDRRKNIDKQFTKLGITNYQYWYVPDYDLEHSKVFKYDSKKLIEQQRCTLGHYTLWKICYELKYDNILIFEDDIIFEDNLDLIQNMLDEYAKSNSDIYLFDYKLRHSQNEYSDYLSTAAYYINQKGLKYIIKQHEYYNSLSDQYWFKFNTDFIDIDKGYNIFVTITPNYKINFHFDKEDLETKLNISSIRFCKQPATL